MELNNCNILTVIAFPNEWKKTTNEDNGAKGYAVTFEVPFITKQFLLQGRVIAYMLSRPKWIPLPLNLTFGGYKTIFGFCCFPLGIRIEIYDSDKDTIIPTRAITFRIIGLEAKYANIDHTDYETIEKLLNPHQRK